MYGLLNQVELEMKIGYGLARLFSFTRVVHAG